MEGCQKGEYGNQNNIDQSNYVQVYPPEIFNNYQMGQSVPTAMYQGMMSPQYQNAYNGVAQWQVWAYRSEDEEGRTMKRNIWYDNRAREMFMKGY